MLHGPHLTKPHLEKLTTSAEGIEAWSNFFCVEKNNGPIITNRGPWVDFFTASLVSPASFDWARRVLSNMWQVFTEGSDECKKFFLPDCCPSKEPLICKLSATAANISQGFSTRQAPRSCALLTANASTLALRVRKPRKPPLVVTEVRSERLRKKAVGFKHSTCVDKHCLACSSKAPVVSQKIVKNLSERFELVMDHEDSDTQSQKKRSKKSSNDSTPTKEKMDKKGKKTQKKLCC